MAQEVSRSGANKPNPYHVYYVIADYDDDAKVWVATSHDVLGLATEAPTREALALKLRVLVPELLDANGAPAPDNYQVVVVSDEAWELITQLKAANCELDRLATDGSYGIWYSRNTQAAFVLDHGLTRRITANRVLEFMGLPERF